MKLNLARRPFVNSRPITRLALALWVAGGALALWNGMEIWRLVGALDDRRRALGAAEAQAIAGQVRIEALQAELRGIDLAAENEESAFLNREIDRRTLPWTGLFQRLGEVLPRQVRLVQIVPALGSSAQRRGPQRGAADDGWLSLALNGYAESDEALLDLVDALFAHPAFDAPDLEREAVPPGEPVQFDLKVSYRPQEVLRSTETSDQQADSERSGSGGESSVPPAPAESGAAGGEQAGSVRAIPVTRSRLPVAGTAIALSRPAPAAPAPVAGDLEPAPAEPVEESSGPAAESESGARWVPREGRAVESALFGESQPSAPQGPGGALRPVPLGATASATRRWR